MIGSVPHAQSTLGQLEACGVSMTMVYVIEGNQPRRIVKAEREVSSSLLSGLARLMREIDGVACD